MFRLNDQMSAVQVDIRTIVIEFLVHNYVPSVLFHALEVMIFFAKFELCVFTLTKY